MLKHWNVLLESRRMMTRPRSLINRAHPAKDAVVMGAEEQFEGGALPVNSLNLSDTSAASGGIEPYYEAWNRSGEKRKKRE